MKPRPANTSITQWPLLKGCQSSFAMADSKTRFRNHDRTIRYFRYLLNPDVRHLLMLMLMLMKLLLQKRKKVAFQKQWIGKIKITILLKTIHIGLRRRKRHREMKWNEMRRSNAYILTYSIHTFILFKTLLMYFMSASYKTTWLINFVTFSLPITWINVSTMDSQSNQTSNLIDTYFLDCFSFFIFF